MTCHVRRGVLKKGTSRQLGLRVGNVLCCGCVCECISGGWRRQAATPSGGVLEGRADYK